MNTKLLNETKYIDFNKNSYQFYTIFNLHKSIGIKANIETTLLPREIFSKQNSTIKVTFKKLISHQISSGFYTEWEWAQEVCLQQFELIKQQVFIS
jgi:hypothetical protein